MKNCYCVKEDKLITIAKFKDCNNCGFSCKTMLLLTEEGEIDYYNDYSELPTMKKLVRNYKREDKLKRILDGQ
jgi:transcription elongation factor Elf1